MPRMNAMKRDMDLIRKILLQIEEENQLVSLADLVQKNLEINIDELRYNVRQLYDSEYISGNILDYMSGAYDLQRIKLSWKAHDFIDSVRDDEIWKKTKKSADEVRGFTFDLMKDLAKGFLKKKIQEHTGIEI
jgi:hypothetical protein